MGRTALIARLCTFARVVPTCTSCCALQWVPDRFVCSICCQHILIFLTTGLHQYNLRSVAHIQQRVTWHAKPQKLKKLLGKWLRQSFAGSSKRGIVDTETEIEMHFTAKQSSPQTAKLIKIKITAHTNQSYTGSSSNIPSNMFILLCLLLLSAAEVRSSFRLVCSYLCWMTKAHIYPKEWPTRIWRYRKRISVVKVSNTLHARNVHMLKYLPSTISIVKFCFQKEIRRRQKLVKVRNF